MAKELYLVVDAVSGFDQPKRKDCHIASLHAQLFREHFPQTFAELAQEDFESIHLLRDTWKSSEDTLRHICDVIGKSPDDALATPALEHDTPHNLMKRIRDLDGTVVAVGRPGTIRVLMQKYVGIDRPCIWGTTYRIRILDGHPYKGRLVKTYDLL